MREIIIKITIKHILKSPCEIIIYNMLLRETSTLKFSINTHPHILYYDTICGII